MKTIKSIIIALIMCFTITSIAQTDTLYLNSGEVIAGVKITKVTSMNVWYTQNKIGKNLSSKEVSRHTFKSENTSQQVKTSTKKDITSVVTCFTLKTISVFGLVSARKNEVRFRKMILDKGYKIKEIYSLPSVGALILYISKTIYLVENQ
jgi:hypothetical protein